jgi:hypothetical protein
VVNGQLGVTPGGKVREDASATASVTPAPTRAPARTAPAGDRGES